MARKKRRRDRAGRGSPGAGDTGERAESDSGAGNQPAGGPSHRTRVPAPMPSMASRLTGLAVAALTAFLAVLLIRTAISDASGADAAVRIVFGALLVLLAVVVAALVIAPAQIRRWLGR